MIGTLGTIGVRKVSGVTATLVAATMAVVAVLVTNGSSILCACVTDPSTVKKPSFCQAVCFMEVEGTTNHSGLMNHLDLRPVGSQECFPTQKPTDGL